VKYPLSCHQRPEVEKKNKAAGSFNTAESRLRNKQSDALLNKVASTVAGNVGERKVLGGSGTFVSDGIPSTSIWGLGRAKEGKKYPRAC